MLLEEVRPPVSKVEDVDKEEVDYTSKMVDMVDKTDKMSIENLDFSTLYPRFIHM